MGYFIFTICYLNYFIHSEYKIKASIYLRAITLLDPSNQSITNIVDSLWILVVLEINPLNNTKILTQASASPIVQVLL